MSYCRWSDPKSDLYCYESIDGFITNVAGNRVVNGARVNIDLGHDGESFVDNNLHKFKARVQMLKDAGYQVPDYVIKSIDEEIAGLGK